MKHLKSYNETVWRRNGSDVNDVTGPRKEMSEIVIDKLTELGLLNRFKYQWNEPRKPYGMPYEMQRYRLDLTLYNYDGVPFDDIEHRLTTLFKYLVDQDIYPLTCQMNIKRFDNTEFKTLLTLNNNGHYYFSDNDDEDLLDGLVKSIYITLQYNKDNISDEYIEKYNKLFK